jgi:hypothetical protein
MRRLIPEYECLSPSLSINRLARFRMLQARVSLVAMVRLRLAASGQDRVCPYPHVPRASGCLCLWVHNLPGQPHLCGVTGEWLPLPPPHLLFRHASSLHDTTSWRALVNRKQLIAELDEKELSNLVFLECPWTKDEGLVVPSGKKLPTSHKGCTWGDRDELLRP